jgi:hypothetical protein
LQLTIYSRSILLAAILLMHTSVLHAQLNLEINHAVAAAATRRVNTNVEMPVGLVVPLKCLTTTNYNVRGGYRPHNSRIIYGLDFGIQEFDLGYRLRGGDAEGNLGFGTGMLWSRYYARIHQKVLVPNIGFTVLQKRKWELCLNVGPCISELQFNARFIDTTLAIKANYGGDSIVEVSYNYTQHTSDFPIRYIKAPALVNQSLQLGLWLNLGCCVRLTKRIGIVTKLQARYSHTTFFTDNTIISNIEVQNAQPVNVQTSFTGTSILAGGGIRYFFAASK